MKNAVLITNPLAGVKSARRSQRIHSSAAILRQSGIETVINLTSKPGDGERLARAAVDRGCDLMIVCGGDGTINEVVNGMATTCTPLAILPGGTANIIAKELRLPGGIVEAARQLPSWQPCRVSLGRAKWEESGSPQQRYFLAVAGIGFDAHIISQLSLPMKHRVGVLAYVWEAVGQALCYGFPRFQCTVDNFTSSATFVVIQRTRRYAGWLRLAREQNIRNPGFSCCLFTNSKRVRYFQYALAVLMGTHARFRDVKMLNGNTVRCSCGSLKETVYFEVDGEMAGRIPVTFDIVPDALTLLAPQSFFTST